MSVGEKGEKVWLPLESNPDLMNSYATQLGLLPGYQFHDVYGIGTISSQFMLVEFGVGLIIVCILSLQILIFSEWYRLR